jgi:hypothetical protein
MRITLLGLFLLIGCGGGSGGGTSFEGIFKVDTWTQNRMTCDAEGPSVATMHEPLFYVKNENFLGQTFVNVNSCVDVATCKSEANDKDTIHIGSFGFEEGSDGSGWTTHSAFAFEVQGSCDGSVTDTKMSITKTTIRIEQRRVDALPFPPSTGEDECPEDKVEMAAQGQPCKELEVVTATFDQSF